MYMITQELDLNMVPGTVPPVINVSQFDTGARTFVFTLYNGATLFNGSVASCRIEGIKPDNKGFSYNASYSNGKVTADCTEQMTAVVGNVLCEIRLLENNEKTLGTLNFILCVERSPLNADVDISETELPPIIDLARKHEQAAAASAAQSAASAQASANSATQSANSARASAASAAQSESIRVDLLNHLNQIDTNTSNISKLRTDVDKHTTDISGLRTDVNKNADDISGLRTDVDKNTSDISSLRTDVDFNDLRISGLRTDVNGLRTDVDKHTTDISKLRTDVNTNAKDITNLATSVQKKNDQQDKDIANLRTDLDADIYKTDRIFDNVFRDGSARLYVKQGLLKFLQGNLRAKGNISVIDELREDVDKNIGDISDLRIDVDTNTNDIGNLRNNIDKNTGDISKLRTDVDDDIYKTDRIYDNVFREGTGRLFAKQGVLHFLQGGLIVKSNISVITELEERVNNNTTEIDKKLNRPLINPNGDLNQLLASNGDGTNSNKWVNLDDILRNSPFIQQIIAMIDANQGALTVDQGRLTFMQGHVKVRTIN